MKILPDSKTLRSWWPGSVLSLAFRDLMHQNYCFHSFSSICKTLRKKNTRIRMLDSHKWNKWHRTGKIRHDLVKKLEKRSRGTVKKRRKVRTFQNIEYRWIRDGNKSEGRNDHEWGKYDMSDGQGRQLEADWKK